MRKVPSELENPIDDLVISIANVVCPFFHKTGHTANMITLYSIIFKILSLRALYESKFRIFALTWMAAYFFDCLDGHFARKYGMVSGLGDALDHVSDMVHFGVAVILLLQKKPPSHLLLLLFTISTLSLKNFGCQQRMYKANNPEEMVEFLDKNQTSCSRMEDIKWTRFFGSGTLQLFFIFAVYKVTGS